MNTITTVEVKNNGVKTRVQKPLIRQLCKGKWIIANKRLIGFAISSLTP